MAKQVGEMNKKRPMARQHVNGASSNSAKRSRETSVRTTPGSGCARILVVDDDRMNRDILTIHLRGEGHVVDTAENGEQALDMLRTASRDAGRQAFDLILLDIEMPHMDGIAVMEQIKANDEWRQVPVIMISAVEEMKSIVRCVQLGAQDYFYKPFDPTLLRARIGACLERRAFYRALLETQGRLTHELAQAASYVHSLLPPPLLNAPVEARWRFVPSAQLGGDGFGYHWLEEDRLAMYLLDVSGHGVGAALLSVSVLNILRGESLPHTDFSQPSQVMTGLNRTFQSVKHSEKFFTIWYGVYRPSTRELSFCSAGHPPAVLASPGRQARLLANDEGLPIAWGIDTPYDCKTVTVPPRNCLYLYSDGVYEIITKEGQAWSLDELTSMLASACDRQENEPEQVEEAIRDLAEGDVFEDDFSLLVFHFV